MSYVDEILRAVSLSGRSGRDISIAAVRHDGAVRNLKRGQDLRVSTLEALCRELGVEFYVGPRRAGGLARALHTGSTLKEVSLAIEELNRLLSKATDLLQSKERERQASAMQKDLERDRKLIEAVKAGSRKHGDGEVLNPPLAAKMELSFDGPIIHEERCNWKIFEYMVPSWASRADLIWVEASDDSMKPMIEAGDPVLVDRSQRVPLENRIHLAVCLHGVAIRRVVRIGPVLAVRTDSAANKDHPPECLNPNAATLLGQVAWHGPREGLHRRWWI